MIELNEPQIWTLIGVFAASTFGMCTLMSTMFVRMMNNGFESLRSEIGGLRTEVNVRFDAAQAVTDARFDRMQAATDARFDRMQAATDARFDHLDRDVQALVRRVFPEYPEAG